MAKGKFNQAAFVEFLRGAIGKSAAPRWEEGVLTFVRQERDGPNGALRGVDLGKSENYRTILDAYNSHIQRTEYVPKSHPHMLDGPAQLTETQYRGRNTDYGLTR